MFPDVMRVIRAFESDNKMLTARFTMRRSRVGSASPKGFVSHVDPKGRFELMHPADWILDGKSVFFARSPRYGTFARVDVLADAPQLWDEIARGAREAGASLTIQERRSRRREHVIAELVVDGRAYRWDACACRVGGTVVLLTTGAPLRDKKEAAVRRWEVGVLGAIRRSFTVPGEGAS